MKIIKPREVLVQQVFPEIRRRCFERGIGFTEVDLRWGITLEQVDRGFVVPICFLKQRLRDHGCDMADYKQPFDLKVLVLEPLWEKIEQKLGVPEVSRYSNITRATIF